MPEAAEDEKPPEGDGVEGGQEAAEPIEPEFEDMDFAIQMTRFDLKRLDMAMEFVLTAVPPYGANSSMSAPFATEDVPRSIDLVRRRALIAAYGLIEREFSPRSEADREDA